MKIEFRGGTRFDIVSGAHRVATDQPVEDGGQDAGMSPVELFVGSLAGCVAYFVGRYCKRHQIPHDGFTVETEWTMAEQPHRVGAISLRLNLPAELTVEQRERLLKVAHGCTVHQSLAVPPTVRVDLHARAGAHGKAGA
ncbi:MAG TPA: OsmC family protein [Nitrospiraceae bacterium]|nr:OsmC family protein [Nitrospiraceae bacterium]